jgi:hypothetical protein
MMPLEGRLLPVLLERSTAGRCADSAAVEPGRGRPIDEAEEGCNDADEDAAATAARPADPSPMDEGIREPDAAAAAGAWL